MRFSICIPNYNYGRYLGQTIESVLSQKGVEFELLISDNASTDNSVEIIRGFSDPRIRLVINPCNVGFAGNLDRVGSLATGDYMIMLPSDDLIKPGALLEYQSLLRELGENSSRVVLSATWDVIDSQGVKTGILGPDKLLWGNGDRTPRFDSVARFPVHAVGAEDLLKRCLMRLKNPFNFAATCFPRALYNEVGGYGGNRLVNPDKWYHWKLLSVADVAYFVDFPLFSYRWHSANQSALEMNAGSLKFLIDESKSTPNSCVGLDSAEKTSFVPFWKSTS
jgi:glycosyltransferase involved in cell wall biosynthesis